MTQEIELPVIPSHISQSILVESLSFPIRATRAAAYAMNNQNPSLLDRELRASYGYVARYGDQIGFARLRGSSFIYGCFDQDAKNRGKLPLVIHPKLIQQHEGQEHRRHRQDEISDQQLKRMIEQEKSKALNILRAMKTHNQYLADAYFELTDTLDRARMHLDYITLFTYGALATYDLFQTQAKLGIAEDFEPLSELPEYNKLPSISSQTVRLVALDILLDRKDFTKSAMEDMIQNSPTLADYIGEVSQKRPEEAGLYLLFSSFTYRCFADEFKRLGIAVPNVKPEAIEASLAWIREIAELSQDEIRRRGREILQRMDQIHDDAFHGNQSLSKWFEILRQAYIPIERYYGTATFMAAFNGLVTVYNPLKTQLANY